MRLTDELHNTIAHRLVHRSRDGIHTIPQELTDDYEEFEQLVKDGKEITSGGYLQWRSRAHEQDAETMAKKLTQLANYGGRPGIIADHLQPALADFVDRFRALWAKAGTYASQPTITADMLAAPDDVRAAIVELQTGLNYTQLRGAYQDLRGGSTNPRNVDASKQDPRGCGSLLAEVRNIADLFPEWETVSQVGGYPPPWGSSCMTHTRLGWILEHGGELWMPTEEQHTTLYLALREAARAKPQIVANRGAVYGVSGMSNNRVAGIRRS